jgi:hypothetical protein
MPATIGYAGPGFLVKYCSTYGDGLYANTVGQVLDIKGPEQVAEFDELTNQSSPAAVPGGRAAKEWIPTLIDGGTVSFPIVYNPADATQSTALTGLQMGTKYSFEIDMGTSGDGLFFDGYFQKFGGNFPYSKKMTVDVEIKVTGPVTGPSAAI